MDWLSIIFGDSGKVNLSLEALARKRFPNDVALSEEAYNYAMDKVTADDFSRLSSFKGNAKASTFLIACFRNAIEDFARKKFGRCSPPTWLVALGESAVTAHRLLCCEHLSANETAHVLSAQSKKEASSYSALLNRILVSVRSCLSHKPSFVSLDQDEIDEGAHAASASLQPAALESGSESLISALWLFINPESEGIPPSQEAALKKIQLRVLQELDLTAEQKLLLKMVKVEDMPMVQAAELLNMKYHTARRALDSALKALRSYFEARGLGKDDL